MKFKAITSVKNVEYTGDVYDIELKEGHYFPANGIITHNCRLRSSLIENSHKEDYTNSFGVGGLSIGSHRVVALNLPQISYLSESWEDFIHNLEHRISLCQDILDIHRETLTKLINKKFLPLYTFGFMNLNKQYSTVGFVGMYESLEILGFDITTEEGTKKGMEIIELINQMNEKRTKIDGFIRNVEQCPAEGAAVAFAKKDAMLFDGKQKYELYSNQYIPLIKECEMHERIRIQGKYDSNVGGGSILHVNVSAPMSKEQMLELMLYATKNNVKYWAVNYGVSQCKTCGKTYVGKFEKSPCHDAETLKFLRIVGFETNLNSWSKERRIEYTQRQFYSL
jgi:anaerobic ribonucleoside-triphosphate reductase